jgi:hypothetical protein
VLGSLAVAGVGLAFAWSRRWAGVLGALVIAVIAAELLHVLGGWGSSTTSSWSRLAASAYGIGGVAAGVVALVTLVRRGATAAVPLLFIAGAFLLVGSGLADITTLWHSQLPTTLPDALDRLTVAITIGGSTAITGGALLHLLRTPRRPVAAREGPPPTGGVPDALHARYRAPTDRVPDHA